MSSSGAKVSKLLILPTNAIALCLFLLLLVPLVLNGATRTASANGNWNSTATWGGASVPVAGDVVIIGASRTVTITANAACTSITFNNGSTLTFSGAFTLNVSGTVTMPSASSNAAITFALGAGTANIGGLFTMNGGNGNASRVNNLTISTGTLNLNGGFTTVTNRSNVIFSSTGVLNISGAISANAMTLTPGTGTVNYIGSTAQNIWVLNYYKLGIAGTATKTCTGILTATNALSVASGSTLALSGAGTPLNFTGVISGTGKVLYSSGSAQNISNATYYDLEFSGAGTKTIAASNIQVGGNLIAGSTTSMTTTGGANVAGNISGAGNITMVSGTITLGGNWTNSGTFTRGTGTVHYNGTNQSVAALTYYNLQISTAGTKSLLGSITVQNQLNIASGTLQTGAFNMLIQGLGNAFICNGVLDPGTGLITFDGSGNVIIPGIIFNNLTTVNGTKTVASGTTVTVNGEWKQNGPTVLDGTANAYIKGPMSGYGTLAMGSGTLSLESGYTSSGTFTPGTGKVIYIGNVGVVKGNWTYYNLEIDGNRTPDGAVTVSNVLTVTSGKTFNIGSTPVNLTGTGSPVVNNGSITSTGGALVFAGAGSQTISAGIYPKTELSNGPKTISTGASVEITDAFLVNAALSMEGTASATITGATTGSGSITMQSGTLTFGSNFAGVGFSHGTGKVIYNGTAAQAVRVDLTYYDLELSSTVSNDFPYGTTNILNNLIIESPTTMSGSVTLNIGNDILGSAQFSAIGFVNLQGDWLHTGTVVPGTGTIHYAGTNQLVKNFGYYKLSMTGGVKSMEGNITAASKVTINAGTGLNMNGYTLELQGPTVDAMSNLGTLTGNGKVWYSLAGAQTVESSTFYDLEFTGGAKTIATGANITTTNDWIVSSTVTMPSSQNATVGRDLVHNASGFIDQGSGIIRIGRNWVYNGGTFDAAQGTVIYEGANQTIAPFTYNTLTCDGSGTKSITGNILINGILTISPGVTFDRASYTVTLPYNGTPFVNNGTLIGNGKFFYTGTGTQNIAPGSYYDLEFTTGIKSLPANQTVVILNDWTISSETNFGANTTVSVSGAINGAGTLTLGNGTLNLAGSWNKTGTFTANNTGIFHYNGSNQNIAALDYYKLQISNAGSKSLSGNTSVRDVLTLNSGSTIGLGAFTLTLSAGGSPIINNGGTINPGTSTVLYTNSGATNIAPGNYYNLTASGGARTLPSGAVVGIAGTFVPGAGGYTVTGSTVNFNGSAQTIPAFNFNDVILSGSLAKTILTATTVVVNSIEIQDGPTLDLSGTAAINITKP